MCHVDVTGVHLISIPAPPRGATRQVLHRARAIHFNSRPSARGDGARRRVVALVLLISIHAPPRGATEPSALDSLRRVHFNSRPSARGDGEDDFGAYAFKLFQFTPPREGRHRLHCIVYSFFPFQFTPPREGRRTSALQAPIATYFNSRPSARGDLRMFSWFTPSPISIHAPPRGATSPACACSTAARYFNSRPSARGNSFSRYFFIARTISIPAPPRGATCELVGVLRDALFQFTPLREGRQQKICNFCKSFVQPSQITVL